MSTAQGLRAEQEIARYLQTQDYAIIARNYRSPWGEVDLIARKQQTLAFIEVKMRKAPTFDLAELITPSKQRKIIKTAQHFLATGSWQSYYCRFDVALLQKDQSVPVYITNAFNAEEL